MIASLDEFELLASKRNWNEILRALDRERQLAIRVFDDPCESTLLISMSSFESVDVVAKLLDLGADPNTVDNCGYSPLRGVLSGLLDQRDTLPNAELLLGAGADPALIIEKGENRTVIDVLKAALAFGDHRRRLEPRGDLQRTSVFAERGYSEAVARSLSYFLVQLESARMRRRGK